MSFFPSKIPLRIGVKKTDQNVTAELSQESRTPRRVKSKPLAMTETKANFKTPATAGKPLPARRFVATVCGDSKLRSVPEMCVLFA